MQVLKENVRDKILNSALNEFKENGYEKSSMRNISKKAGMTSGNIYRYYKNKDELFDAVVKPIYESYVTSIKDLEKKVQLSYTEKARANENYFDNFEDTIVDLLKSFTSEMSILLNCSVGSRYEHVKSDLTNLAFSALESMFTREKNNEKLQQHDVSHVKMYASFLVEGICLILKDYKKGENVKDLVDGFLNMYSAGMKSVLKQIKS